MIELNLTDLKEMITSPDAESRRLGLTMVAENINEIPETEVTSFKKAYESIINTRMGITGGFHFNNDDNEYFKTHPLTWGSVQMDARFIIENVTKDEPTLKSIFPINVEYLLNEYKEYAKTTTRTSR
jgi:hypothetical protein